MVQIVKISNKLLESIFCEGNEHHYKIIRGIIPKSKLIGITYKRDSECLELMFNQVEECKEIDVEVEDLKQGKAGQ